MSSQRALEGGGASDGPPMAPSPELLRRLPYYALGLLAFYLIYTLSLIGKPEGWLLDGTGRYWLNDFAGVWTAGDVTNRGLPERAYDIAGLCAEQVALRGAPMQGCYPWPYPPHVLPLAAALATLPFMSAMILWLAATGSAYAAMARMLTGSWRGVALMLAGPATLNTLYTGQNGFLSAALLGAGLLLLPTRPVLSGIAIGLLAYKPHLGLMIPLALLAAGQWRAIAAAGLTVSAVVAASVAYHGPDIWHLFILQLGNIASVMQTHFDTSKLRSMFGLLQTLGLPVSTSLAAHSLMALAIAGSVIWAWRSHLAYELKAALLATAAIMASPYVFAYDLVLLCVAQAFLVRHILARGGVTMPEFAGLAMVNLLQPLSGALSGLLLIALVFRRAAMEETVDRQGAAAPLPAI